MFRPIQKTNIFRPTQIKYDPSYSGNHVPSCPVKHLLSGEICSYPGKHIPSYPGKHVSVLSQEKIFRPTQENMFPAYPGNIFRQENIFRPAQENILCFRPTQEHIFRPNQETYFLIPRKTYVSVLPRTIIIIVIIMSISVAHAP